MEKDIEDIRKLDAAIKEEHDCNTFRDEFDDFINHSISDDEEQFECVDEDELIQIEDAIDNIVDDSDHNLYHSVENLKFSTDLNLVKHFLSLEEIKVINGCRDAKLKKILNLNRAKHVQLQNIRYKLYELLKQCKVSLKVYEDKIQKFKADDTQIFKSIIPKLGHPYYKTKDFYSCSPNADTLRKQKSKEICIDYLPQLSRWTLEDQIILKRAIIFNYTNDLVEKYESELNSLKFAEKNANNEEAASIQKHILEITDKLAKLKENQDPAPPPLDSSAEINWMTISNSDFAGRHSPQACKAFWNIYLHTSINKAYWSDKENNEIQKLAKTYNFQNWEEIAMKLKNNRSGFAVCVHYYTTLSDKFRKNRFDLEEDQFLVDVVNACRIGNYIPWSKVCHYFQNRSRSQLYHRYKYNLEFWNMKKGPFSCAEDALLGLLVRKFGKDFTRCCKYIPNRSPSQIAHRYNNYIAFDKLDLGCWSLAEDEAIMNHVAENGEKAWSKLFSIVKTKNRTHLRLRYFYLRKWLQMNSDKQLSEIPRRIKRSRRSDAVYMVKSCIEYFSNSTQIPTLFEIGEHLKTLGQVPSASSTMTRPLQCRIVSDNIDKELIQYFQSTCKIKTSKSISAQEVQHIVGVTKTLMSIFDIELTIPDCNSLQNNPKLDILDKEILTLLFTDKSRTDNTTSETPTNTSKVLKFSKNNFISYLPPNINTLVGVRSLLLMHESYRSKCSSKSSLNKIISRKVTTTNNVTSNISNEVQNLVLIEQEKYTKRFNAIFKWPALMSIMEPSENLIVNHSTRREQPTFKIPQRVGRPKKNLIKIELMNKARLQNSTQRKLLNTNIVETIRGDSLSETCDEQSTSKTTPTQPKTYTKAKRSNDTEVNKQNAKKARTNCDSNEIKELQEDIHKLDNLLMSELDGK